MPDIVPMTPLVTSRARAILRAVPGLGARRSRPRPNVPFRRSSVVERAAVNRLVVGSSPTAGATHVQIRPVDTFIGRGLPDRDCAALAAVDVDSLEQVADPSHAGVERGWLHDTSGAGSRFRDGVILAIPEQQVHGSTPSDGSTLAPNGRVAGECSGSSDELAFRERAALHDIDPSFPTVFRVIGSDLVGEVPDDLAVTDQQQVVVEREGVDDPIEEGPHMFGAPAVAWPLMLRGRATGGAMTPGDTGVDAMAPRGFGTPLHDPGRVGRDPDSGRAEIYHVTSS